MPLSSYRNKKMAIATIFLATLLLLCLPVSTNCQEGRGGYDKGTVVVYVDTETGKDESCLPPHTDTPCSSLEAIASGITSMENLTSLEIVIRSPLLELKEPIKFEGLVVVRIVGAPTRIECVSNSSAEASGNSTAGAIFVAVEDLILEDLAFDHCGAFYNYTAVWEDDFRSTFRAAVHILNFTSAMVRGITASYSNGAGMAVSTVQEGIVNVSDSLFEHNTIPVTDRLRYAGGGGIFVQIQHVSPSDFVFQNCTFLSNNPSTTREFIFPNIFGTIIKGRGQGGGLLARLSNEATNNRITVSSCKFIGNSAFFGGGLAIVMSDQSRNNLAVVRDSYFEENGCQPGSESGSAGGAHLGYSYYDNNREYARDNMIVVRDSVFTRNCAELNGGGTAFFSSRSRYRNSKNGVSFINCSWIENSGHIGAAIDISPHFSERLSAGFLPTPEFTDCQFLNNSITFRKEHHHQQITGTGALFTSLLNIKFLSSVLFERNTDSALIVVNAVADFSSCSATFMNNTGVQGGAISLVGVSSMIVGPGFTYKFLNNKATGRGGAISSYLIDEHDFSISKSCLIQYSEQVPPTEWNTTLAFYGNEVPIGNSIFITAITACLLSSTFSLDINYNRSFAWDPSEVFRWPGVFYFDDGPMENQIATDGAYFEVVGEVPFEIIPGEKHSLQVDITDDLNQLADTTLRATISKAEGTSIEVDKSYSFVEDKRIQLRGHVGDTGGLLLQVVSLRKTSILVDVVLSPCPVGFSLNEEKECECDVNSYEGLTKCSTSSLTAYIREGFWAGYVASGSSGMNLVTAICPVEFCQYSGSDEKAENLLPRTSSNVDLDSFICGPTRTGTLCGDCIQGHTAYYHSPYFSCRETKLCSIGWLLFILSELVPATILFIVVLVFNINFTSGSLNGFILFSQLLNTLFIDANDVIKVPNAVHHLSQGYRTIYGIFSLEFFTLEPLSFCLWEGATVLDALAFKYVTIAYSLILIILIIVFMKYFARRLFGNRVKISAMQISVIHGLSAFLVLCFMQSIEVSLKILLPMSLQGRGGALLSPARVWLSGEIEVFSPEHLPYAIPALLCLLTFGIVPPIVLLAYPLNSKIASLLNVSGTSYPKLTHLSRKISLSKFKPILDSFQGCFKDNLRFFAGLYFVYRWVGLLAYAISPNLNGFYVTLQAMLLFILMIHAVAQPYKNRWHNVVDALLLTDLALINLLTGFNYYYTRVTAEEVRVQQAVNTTSSIQLILIYLPILSMAAFLTIKGYQKYCSRKKPTAKDGMELLSNVSSAASVKCKDRQATSAKFTSIEDFPARLLGSNVEYREMKLEYKR